MPIGINPPAELNQSIYCLIIVKSGEDRGLLISNNLINENHCHQYLYVLSDNLTLKINSKKYNFKKDDTFYLKPFTKFCFINKGAKILILRVSDSMSGENLLQLSQIGKKNIQRVIMENKKWF